MEQLRRLATRAVDRVFPPRPELLACREAHADLWISSAAEEAAGVMVETPEFCHLNGLANDTDARLTRVERWLRLLSGTDNVISDRQRAAL
jgi:uncharacterized protein YcaQ